MVLGKVLRELRLGRRLTQREVASAIGITPSALGMYESSKREPDLETLGKLADFFGVSVEFLLGRERKLSPDQQLYQIGVYLRGAGATEEDVTTILNLLENRRKLREAAKNTGQEK